MKKIRLIISSILLLSLLWLCFVACQRSKDPEIEDASSTATVPTRSNTIYRFYPEDISVYGDKAVLHYGYLNYVFDNDTSEAYNIIWQEWNDYLVSIGAPYIMQLVTCSNGELYTPEMLYQAEEELGFTFDIVSYYKNHFSAEELADCFQPLEPYFNDALYQAYQSMPSNYWDLIATDSHIYNISFPQIDQFQSFGYAWLPDEQPSESLLSLLTTKDTPEDSLEYVTKNIETATKGVQWLLPNGSFTLFQRLDLVRITFQRWGTESYFDYVAPLVGIDFIGGTDEIICILDSPLFIQVSNLFKSIYSTGNYTGDYASYDISLKSNWDMYPDQFILVNEGDMYYNSEYYTKQKSISLRKDTALLEYTLDFVNSVISDTEFAKHFYGIYRFPEPEEWRAISNRLVLLYPSDLPDLNTSTLVKQYTEYAQKTPAAGFILDDSNIQEEIKAIENYLLPQSEKSGTYDRLTNTEEWEHFDEIKEQMRQELNELGLQKILDEANRQYQEWKSNQELE